MIRPLRVGLISDTHGLLRPAVVERLAGVDVIVHAGDVGGPSVLQGLAAIARVEAVSGNVDDRFDPELPRERTMPIGRLTLHVSHGDECGHPTPERLMARYTGDILVYGHTHKPLAITSEDGRLVVNPGSAGPRRFTLPISLAILTIGEGPPQVEFVTL